MDDITVEKCVRDSLLGKRESRLPLYCKSARIVPDW
jgi:hypothetical protein